MTLTAEPCSVSCQSRARQRSLSCAPGILVFGYTGKLEHVNRRAWELIRGCNDSGCDALPLSLIALRDEIHACLSERLAAHVWDAFEVSRVMSDGKDRVLVRGYGQPDSEGHAGRIILCLEEFQIHHSDE